MKFMLKVEVEANNQLHAYQQIAELINIKNIDRDKLKIVKVTKMRKKK